MKVPSHSAEMDELVALARRSDSAAEDELLEGVLALARAQRLSAAAQEKLATVLAALIGRMGPASRALAVARIARLRDISAVSFSTATAGQSDGTRLARLVAAREATTDAALAELAGDDRLNEVIVFVAERLGMPVASVETHMLSRDDAGAAALARLLGVHEDGYGHIVRLRRRLDLSRTEVMKAVLEFIDLDRVQAARITDGRPGRR